MKRREYDPQDANCFLCREEPLEAYWHQMPDCEIQHLSRSWFWKHYEYILVFLDKATDEFVDQLDGFRTAKAARDYAIARAFGLSGIINQNGQSGLRPGCPSDPKGGTAVPVSECNDLYGHRQQRKP